MKLDGGKIKMLSHDGGISLSNLSDLAGVSRCNFSSICNGKRCREDTAQKIANALGVRLNDIVVPEVLHTPGVSNLDKLGLKGRTYNALMRNGIDTIGKLCVLTDDELLKFRYLGRDCLAEIRSIIPEPKAAMETDRVGNITKILEWAKQDGYTLSYGLLRKMLNEGQIPYTKAGNQFLINYKNVKKFFKEA